LPAAVLPRDRIGITGNVVHAIVQRPTTSDAVHIAVFAAGGVWRLVCFGDKVDLNAQRVLPLDTQATCGQCLRRINWRGANRGRWAY
jgi:hypothetical protein